jgi:hypothetical protein
MTSRIRKELNALATETLTNSDGGDLMETETINPETDIETKNDDLSGLVSSTVPEAEDDEVEESHLEPGFHIFRSEFKDDMIFSAYYANPLWVEGVEPVRVNTMYRGWKIAIPWLYAMTDMHLAGSEGASYQKVGHCAHVRYNGNMLVDISAKGVNIYKAGRGVAAIEIPGMDSVICYKFPEKIAIGTSWVELSKLGTKFEFGGVCSGYEMPKYERLSTLMSGANITFKKLASKADMLKMDKKEPKRAAGIRASEKTNRFIINEFYYYKQALVEYVHGLFSGTKEEANQIQREHKQAAKVKSAGKAQVTHHADVRRNAGEAATLANTKLALDPAWVKSAKIKADGKLITEENGMLWLSCNQLDGKYVLRLINARNGMFNPALDKLTLDTAEPTERTIDAINANANPNFIVWRFVAQ